MNSGAKNDPDRTQRWTEQFLNQRRLTADPLGDEIITVLARERGNDGLNSVWQMLLKGNPRLQDEFPAQVHELLDETLLLPPWADVSLIARGETFFDDCGPLCLVSLLCASLPECYVLRNEAEVLGTTRNLETHAYRRIFQTAQMIKDVMSRGGLAPCGPGVLAARKVRLMHAIIRHLILTMPRQLEALAPPKSFPEAVQRMPAWDIDRLGRPINQEDMAYTLLTFSHVILLSFQRMKIEVAPDEAEAYLHCWNVVGYLTGVREDLMAASRPEAECLFSAIKTRQAAESEAGQALTAALTVATGAIIVRETDGWLSRVTVKRFPPVIMRQLLDRKTRKILKIKRLRFGEWIMLGVLRVLVVIFENLYQRAINVLGTKFGNLILDRLTEIQNDPKKANAARIGQI
jgi:hypothetical protein